MLYFRIFCKKISKPRVKFSRDWTKNNSSGKVWENFENVWWKFNWKIEFLYFLGKFVAKNRNFGNNFIFLPQFFLVLGGVDPPAYATGWMRILILFAGSSRAGIYLEKAGAKVCRKNFWNGKKRVLGGNNISNLSALKWLAEI